MLMGRDGKGRDEGVLGMTCRQEAVVEDEVLQKMSTT
jgi:hypothetical protein